jgi:hypothetical protein
MKSCQPAARVAAAAAAAATIRHHFIDPLQTSTSSLGRALIVTSSRPFEPSVTPDHAVSLLDVHACGLTYQASLIIVLRQIPCSSTPLLQQCHNPATVLQS